MKQRKLTFIICSFYTLLVSISCLQNDLLRYGNNYNCDGYFTTDRMDEQFLSAYGTIPSRTDASWHQQSNSVVFKDAKSILYVWQQTSPEDLELVGNISLGLYTKLALGGNYSLAAVSRGSRTTSRTFLFEFGEGEPDNRITVIERVSGSVLHPSQLLLAGNYYPREEDYNIIAVFDLTSDKSTPIATYELRYDVGPVFGWSNNGDIIAVAGDDPKGLIMHYIYTDTGDIEQSQFQDAGSCVADAAWSPNEQSIAYSGESIAGWDIYLETVANLGGNYRYLENLTNTPKEDERGVAWSPSGSHIVYVKTFADTDGRIHQELFLMDISDPEAEPIQLTDTLNEYESGPMWISDDEILYLSVSVPEQGFLLKSLSVSDQETQTLFVIPEKWNQ